MSANRWLWVLAVAVLATADRGAAQPPGRGNARSEVRGVLRAVDPAGKTITVTAAEGRRDDRQPPTDTVYRLAPDAEVAIDGGRRGVPRPGQLADLAPGAVVSLTLSADQKAVESVLAEGPVVRGRVTAVDPKAGTLTVALLAERREAGAEEKSFTLAADAEIGVDDGRGRRFSVREGKRADLAAGGFVTLRLSPDQKQVVSVLAEGPNVVGTVKAVDAGKKTITVAAAPGRGGEAAEEKTLAVSADATVLLDDGRGRRLSVKEGKLSDVPAGAAVQLKLSPDQKAVAMLRAEGASVPGLLKAVDPEKGTVTVVVRKGRGEEPEEKTWALAKGARVVVEGKDGSLADLKAGDEAFVVVRLSLDQKAVTAIQAGRGGR